MNDSKFCEVCKSKTLGYEHPVFTVCSLECLKLLKPKPTKLKYVAMRQKGSGKSHLILVQETNYFGPKTFYSTANRKSPPKQKKRTRSK